MLALRLVLDTNVVVSAALKPDGLPRTVLLCARRVECDVRCPGAAAYKVFSEKERGS